MSSETVDMKELAAQLGVDYHEAVEKHRLVNLIRTTRKKAQMSQAKLAKKVGVTQGRIAQIETGIGTSGMTFDLLFSILKHLGYQWHIVTKKAS
jgi:DNA-binding XRE family transcriptional regulator